MNHHVGITRRYLTRAAEGLDRRGFTVAEVEAMEDAGIIGPDETYELIEGEVVPKQAKNNRHEVFKSELLTRLARLLPDHLRIGVETSIRLGELTMVEPDICLYPKHLKLEDVRGTDLLVVIEIADSRLAYDRGKKREIYARYGVPLYWSIDVAATRILVLTDPKHVGTWGGEVELDADALLTLDAVPGFALRLAEIEV